MNKFCSIITVVSLLHCASIALAADPPKKLKLRQNTPDASTPPTAPTATPAAAPAAAKTGGIWKEPTTGIEFLPVKGGCYEMGDIFGDGQDDEKPVHEVCVSDFAMGKT